MFNLFMQIHLSKDRMLSFLGIRLIDSLKDHLPAILDHLIRLDQVAVPSLDYFLHHGGLFFLLSPIAHHTGSLLRSWVSGDSTKLRASSGAGALSSGGLTLFRAGVSIVRVIVNDSDTMMLLKVCENVSRMRLMLLHGCSRFEYLINHNFPLRFIRNVYDPLYHVVTELISHQVLQSNDVVVRRTTDILSLIRHLLFLTTTRHSYQQYLINDLFLLLLITMY